jgi:hypothetical protein
VFSVKNRVRRLADAGRPDAQLHPRCLQDEIALGMNAAELFLAVRGMRRILPHHQFTQQTIENLMEFSICEDEELFMWQQFIWWLVAGAQALVVYEASV